jgi:hypothetical protein
MLAIVAAGACAERAARDLLTTASRCVSARLNGILRKVALTQLGQGGLSA